MRWGKRKHSFWDDPVWDMLSYLCEPRPWANKIVAIAYNAKAFDLHFILNRAIVLKWNSKLIMKDHVYEDEAPGLFGQCVLPSLCIA